MLSSPAGQSPPRQVPHGCLLCRQFAKAGDPWVTALRCKWGGGPAGLCQAEPRRKRVWTVTSLLPEK